MQDEATVREIMRLSARIKELEEGLGTAAQVARQEVRDLQCGEVVEQAVFHAVKAVARRALARKEDKNESA